MSSLQPCVACQTPAKLSACAKCSHLMYCSRACQVSHWNLHKGTCSPLFEVFQSTQINGGKGLRASRSIQPGEEIFREYPALRCPNGHAARTREEAQALHVKFITAKFSQLSPKRQEAIMALSSLPKYNGGDGQPTTLGIYQTNSIRLTGADESDGAIFLAMARMNHSCRPNVHQIWRQDLQMMLLFAIAKIEAGDELYMTYGPSEPMDTAGRRKHLRQEFGFDCLCSMCTSKDEQGDERMRELSRLNARVRELVSRGKHEEALASIEQCTVLLDEQQIGAGGYAKPLFNMGYQIASRGLKNSKLAKSYLQRELTVVEMCEGVASPRAVELLSMIGGK